MEGLRASVGAQSGDSIKEYPAMTNRTNADLLQVFLRQVRKDPFVDLVLAECRLVAFEAKAPQPISEVHDIARTSPA